MNNTKLTLPKQFRGKYVSRAAFAKVQADRDRMKKDIYNLVMRDGADIERFRTYSKWKKEFTFWKDINAALVEIAKKELPEMLKRQNERPGK